MLGDPDADRAIAVASAVRDVVSAFKKPARTRQRDVSGLVASIAEYAYDRGLNGPLIEELLEALASKTTLGQSEVTTLIRNLFPAERVSSTCVMTIVSSLGVGKLKPSLPSQGLLIRWLCNVYSVLEEPSVLARLYSVLWSLLDVMSIRGPLCRLLTLITRRQHVKPFRIQHLYTLSTAAGDTYEVRMLCDAYKGYCPDISYGIQAQARPNAAAKSDAAWRARLAEMRASHPTSGPAIFDRQHVPEGIGKQGHRIVPRLHTRLNTSATFAIETMGNSIELVEGLESVELPYQLAAVLENPLLQQYLQLRPSSDADMRLNLWLAQCLDDLLAAEASEHSAAHTTEMLSLVNGYVKALKTMPPLIEAFVPKYLRRWVGTADTEIVLELLTYMPGYNFRALHRHCLSVLESCIGRNHADSLELLSRFYSALLRKRMSGLSMTRRTEEAAFINDLQEHVATLHLSALVSLSEGNATVSSIVRFHETLAQLSETAASSPVAAAAVILPSPRIIFLMVFAFQLDALSRVCSILTVYKAAFETGIKSSIKWPVDFTNQFNGYLMDVCNLLWRSRAFTTADPNSLGCLCPEATAASLRKYLTFVDREYTLASLFGFSHSMLLASFSLKALEQLEREQGARYGRDLTPHIGPASQRTLMALEKEGGARVSWKEYRLACLQRLYEYGIVGIRDLMYTTMRDLTRPA